MNIRKAAFVLLAANLVCSTFAHSTTGRQPRFASSNSEYTRAAVFALVNTAESHQHFSDFVSCVFGARRPSVAGVPFDVHVVVHGGDDGIDFAARRGAVVDVVDRAVGATALHGDARPMIDVTSSVGSEAGVFLKALGTMSGAKPPWRIAEAKSRDLQTYSHAVILDTQVCALRNGWLDAAIANMSINGVGAIAYPSSLSTPHALLPSLPLVLHLSTPGTRAVLEHASIQLSYDASTRGGGATPLASAISAAVQAQGSPSGLVRVSPRLLATTSLPVDVALFKQAAYYGLDRRASLVRVPRQLRVDSATAVAAHLTTRPAVVMALPTAGVPGLSNLIHAAHASYVRVGFSPVKSIAFVACTRRGFEEASRLAPQRVLVTRPTAGPTDSMAAVLAAVSSLAYAGVGTFLLVGLDTVAIKPVHAPLQALLGNGGGIPSVYLPGEAVPVKRRSKILASVRTPAATAFCVSSHSGFAYFTAPANDAARIGAAILAWAHLASRSKAACMPCRDVALLLSRYLRVATFSGTLASRASDSGTAWPAFGYLAGFSQPPAIIHGLGQQASPHRAPVDATFMPRWAARTEFRFRQAGLWSAGPGAMCSSYSAMSHGPLILDSPAAARAAVRQIAAFMAFARARDLDCAVLPGFILGGPGGRVVPYDAVVDGDALSAMAGPNMMLYPRLAGMDVAGAKFVPFWVKKR